MSCPMNDTKVAGERCPGCGSTDTEHQFTDDKKRFKGFECSECGTKYLWDGDSRHVPELVTDGEGAAIGWRVDRESEQ